jgi:hypothetical protein
MYSAEAVSYAIGGTIAKVARLVRLNKLPAPCKVIDGKPFWRAVVVEPALAARGHVPPAVADDEMIAARRAEQAEKKSRPPSRSQAQRLRWQRRKHGEPAEKLGGNTLEGFGPSKNMFQ